MYEPRSDSFFSIGSTHEVCQDYARNGMVNGGLQYAIISDGCSSSPDTDFGARILTMNTVELLSRDIEFNGNTLIQKAKESTILPISQRCLDATLLMAYHANNLLTIRISGDGVIIFKFNGGDIKYIDCEYPKGAPAYLSYFLNSDRKEQYLKEYGDSMQMKYFGLHTNTPFHVNTYNEFMCDDNLKTLCYAGNGQYIEMVLLCSDGVHSFTDGINPIPVKDVITKIADIRNYKGNFIKRNMKFFLQRECKKLGWSHTDDLSVAGIYMPPYNMEQ
jgi:hypothetical protein